MFSCQLAHDGKSAPVRPEEAGRREIAAREVEKSGLNKLPEMPKKCKNTHNISPDSTVRNNFSERLESQTFSSLIELRDEKHQSWEEVDIESNYEELFGDWWEEHSDKDDSEDVCEENYDEIPSFNWGHVTSNGDCYKYDIYFEDQFLNEDCACGMLRKVD